MKRKRREKRRISGIGEVSGEGRWRTEGKNEAAGPLWWKGAKMPLPLMEEDKLETK